MVEEDAKIIRRMLFKPQPGGAFYGRVTGERHEVALALGVVGEEKPREERTVTGCADLPAAVDAEVIKLKAEGYEEPPKESYHRVSAAVPTAGLTRYAAEERVAAVQDTFSEYVGWTGNGLPLGSDTERVTGGARVSSLIYDRALAARQIPEWFDGQNIHPEVVVTIDNADGTREIVWPGDEAGKGSTGCRPGRRRHQAP